MMTRSSHHYIDRASGNVHAERPYQDGVVQFLYGPVREYMPALFRQLISRRSTRLLGYLNYDSRWGAPAVRRFMRMHAIDATECLDDAAGFRTPRQLFERRIRYWETRPMPDGEQMVCSPCDARMLCGDCGDSTLLDIKQKLFHCDELLGRNTQWPDHFINGHYALFRLTPDKYHYNHLPVTGVVRDLYEVEGCFHSCNPGAAIRVAQPYSKNHRVVTVLDTDVPGGSGCGLVAMVEVVALMIGEIVQCYSDTRYVRPRAIRAGMFVKRGQPKSLFRPGSSTTVLLFQAGRVRFADDLLRNQARADIASRYSIASASPAVETDVRVRSFIATGQPAGALTRVPVSSQHGFPDHAGEVLSSCS